MAVTIVEAVKRYLGGCPNAASSKTRTYTAPEFENLTRTPEPVRPGVPESSGIGSAEHRPGYLENILLILLFLGSRVCQQKFLTRITDG